MKAAILEGNAIAEEISGLTERVTFHNDDSGFFGKQCRRPQPKGSRGTSGSQQW